MVWHKPNGYEVFTLLVFLQSGLDQWQGTGHVLGNLDEFIGMLFHMIDAMIDRNPVQPRLQAGFPPETRKMFESFDEYLLGKIHGIFPVFHKAIANPVNLPLIADHQFIKRAHVAGEVSFNKGGIRVLVS